MIIKNMLFLLLSLIGIVCFIKELNKRRNTNISFMFKLSIIFVILSGICAFAISSNNIFLYIKDISYWNNIFTLVGFFTILIMCMATWQYAEKNNNEKLKKVVLKHGGFWLILIIFLELKTYWDKIKTLFMNFFW